MRFIQKLLSCARNDRPQSPFAPASTNPEIVTGHEKLAVYPPKTFLGAQGLCAYYTLFVLSTDALAPLQELIAARFTQQEVTSDVTLINANQEALTISYREAFGGTLMEITTNSIAMIQALDTYLPAPPAPWNAFVGMQPIEAQLNKQGSLAFWWEHIWLPFWSAQTSAQKAQYLDEQHATAPWIEVLTEHLDTQGRPSDVL